MRIPVLPDDGSRGARDFDDAGVGRGFSLSEGAVVEDEDVAVGELGRAVLLCED